MTISLGKVTVTFFQKKYPRNLDSLKDLGLFCLFM